MRSRRRMLRCVIGSGWVIGFGQWVQRSGVQDSPMGPMRLVVPFVLVHGVQQMTLGPDQCPVQQFVPAALDPPFHDGVHAENLDAAECRLNANVGEDRVGQGGELPVAVADEVPSCAGRRRPDPWRVSARLA
jgi:hypothetical protein